MVNKWQQQVQMENEAQKQRFENIYRKTPAERIHQQQETNRIAAELSREVIYCENELREAESHVMTPEKLRLAKENTDRLNKEIAAGDPVHTRRWNETAQRFNRQAWRHITKDTIEKDKREIDVSMARGALASAQARLAAFYEGLANPQKD